MIAAAPNIPMHKNSDEKKINVVLLSISIAIGVMLACMLSQRGFVLAQDEQIQVIELAAKKYEYSRAPVLVKEGTEVRHKINATDHDHGFKVAPVPDGTQPSDKPGLVFAQLTVTVAAVVAVMAPLEPLTATV